MVKCHKLHYSVNLSTDNIHDQIIPLHHPHDTTPSI